MMLCIWDWNNDQRRHINLAFEINSKAEVELQVCRSYGLISPTVFPLQDVKITQMNDDTDAILA